MFVYLYVGLRIGFTVCCGDVSQKLRTNFTTFLQVHVWLGLSVTRMEYAIVYVHPVLWMTSCFNKRTIRIPDEGGRDGDGL